MQLYHVEIGFHNEFCGCYGAQTEQSYYFTNKYKAKEKYNSILNDMKNKNGFFANRKGNYYSEYTANNITFQDVFVLDDPYHDEELYFVGITEIETED